MGEIKVFVDSNIFIFANIAEYPEQETAKEKLKLRTQQKTA